MVIRSVQQNPPRSRTHLFSEQPKLTAEVSTKCYLAVRCDGVRISRFTLSFEKIVSYTNSAAGAGWPSKVFCSFRPSHAWFDLVRTVMIALWLNLILRKYSPFSVVKISAQRYLDLVFQFSQKLVCEGGVLKALRFQSKPQIHFPGFLIR